MIIPKIIGNIRYIGKIIHRNTESLSNSLPWLFKKYLYFHTSASPDLITLNYFCWYFILPRTVCRADFFKMFFTPCSPITSVIRGKTQHEKHIQCFTLSECFEYCKVSGIKITQRECYWSIWPKCQQVYFLAIL